MLYMPAIHVIVLFDEVDECLGVYKPLSKLFLTTDGKYVLFEVKNLISGSSSIAVGAEANINLHNTFIFRNHCRINFSWISVFRLFLIKVFKIVY